MDELARRVTESLEAGRDPADALATAGAPQPAEDAASLRAAARHPDLAAHLAEWVPGLLASARPGAGARQLASLADAARAAGAPLAAPLARGVLAKLLGDSAFLARWLVREPAWAADFADGLAPPPEPVHDEADWSALRRAKYRGLLRIAARDLAGRPFADGLTELSDLADGVLRRGLVLAADDREPPALFALGKLGGRELNFSSDVDLLFVCDAAPDAGGHAQREAAAGVVRDLKRRLEEPSADGFGYRVDLDLRPEGPPGALVRSPEATLAYYELRGAEWERQMLLRLRHVCGAPELAREFERGIEPFVYRRSIDPGVIDSVRDMKARIEAERRAGGRDPLGNLKEAPGGIRDVEFTVQALQLFHAGREPELRTGHVLDAIAALAAAGHLPETSAAALDAGYRWLRRAEHALQLADEQQTAQVPRQKAARTALARRMGYAEPEAEAARHHFEADWDRVQGQVRAEFEALLPHSGRQSA